MLCPIEIKSLRDIGVEVTISIEIESLRDILFPVRGIKINRKWDISHFQITLAEGLISICTLMMYGMRINFITPRHRRPHFLAKEVVKLNSLVSPAVWPSAVVKWEPKTVKPY